MPLRSATPIGDLLIGHTSPMEARWLVLPDGPPVAVTGSGDVAVRVWGPDHHRHPAPSATPQA